MTKKERLIFLVAWFVLYGACVYGYALSPMAQPAHECVPPVTDDGKRNFSRATVCE